jgi:hypothetical protein
VWPGPRGGVGAGGGVGRGGVKGGGLRAGVWGMGACGRVETGDDWWVVYVFVWMFAACCEKIRGVCVDKSWDWREWPGREAGWRAAGVGTRNGRVIRGVRTYTLPQDGRSARWNVRVRCVAIGRGRWLAGGAGATVRPCSRAASAGVEGGLALDDVQHDCGLAAGGPTLNLLAGGVAGARLAALTDRTSRTNTDRRVVACHDGSPVHPLSCAQRGWGTGHRGLAAGGPTLNLLTARVASARQAALTDRTRRAKADRSVLACHDGSPVHPLSRAQRRWGTGHAWRGVHTESTRPSGPDLRCGVHVPACMPPR